MPEEFPDDPDKAVWTGAPTLNLTLRLALTLPLTLALPLTLTNRHKNACTEKLTTQKLNLILTMEPYSYPS